MIINSKVNDHLSRVTFSQYLLSTVIELFVLVIKWKLLNEITLGQRRTDSNN
jgi:hypothetical protein